MSIETIPPPPPPAPAYGTQPANPYPEEAKSPWYKSEFFITRPVKLEEIMNFSRQSALIPDCATGPGGYRYRCRMAESSFGVTRPFGRSVRLRRVPPRSAVEVESHVRSVEIQSERERLSCCETRPLAIRRHMSIPSRGLGSRGIPISVGLGEATGMGRAGTRAGAQCSSVTAR